MDIIRKIIREVIEEKFGLPSSIKKYNDRIVNDLSPKIENIIFQMKQRGIGKYDTSDVIIFDSSDPSFPIDSVSVAYDINIYPQDRMKKDIFIDGMADRDLGMQDGNLNPLIKMSISIGDEVDVNLKKEMGDFLSHEMTHVFEFYNREKTGAQTKGDFLNFITNKQMGGKFPREWKNFLTLIYYTIDFENNARVAQTRNLVNNMRENGSGNDEIMSAIKQSEAWEVYEKLSSFSPNDLLNQMDSLIDAQGVRDKGVTTDKIINTYKKRLSDTFEDTNIKLSDMEKKFLRRTKEMNPDEFLSSWENHFKSEAEKYKKRLLKTLS